LVVLVETGKRIQSLFKESSNFLPSAFGQKLGDVPRQIPGQQRKGLPFGVRQISADMNQRVAFDVLVE
jgi:hypothetical protein